MRVIDLAKCVSRELTVVEGRFFVNCIDGKSCVQDRKPVAYAWKREKGKCLDALENLLRLKPEMKGWVRNYAAFEWLRGDAEFRRLVEE